MIRRLAVISLLLAATAAQAQHQATPAERTRLATMGAALGRCHHGIVLRDARTRFTPDQIAARALSACASREAPIRAELTRQIGPQRAAAVLQGQRAHWRQAIGQMVAQARGAR